MNLKYLYSCNTLKEYNRAKQSGQLMGINIVTSRKNMIVLSEKLLPMRKLNGIELYVFAKLDTQDFEDAEKWF